MNPILPQHRQHSSWHHIVTSHAGTSARGNVCFSKFILRSQCVYIVRYIHVIYVFVFIGVIKYQHVHSVGEVLVFMHGTWIMRVASDNNGATEDFFFSGIRCFSHIRTGICCSIFRFDF